MNDNNQQSLKKALTPKQRVMLAKLKAQAAKEQTISNITQGKIETNPNKPKEERKEVKYEDLPDFLKNFIKEKAANKMLRI